MISLSQRRQKTEAQALVRAINKQQRAEKRASLPKVERVVPVRDGRQRQPRLRDKVYLGWVAQLPCVACLVQGVLRYGVHVAHCRMSDAAAGWRNPGLQSKPGDDRCTPLCPEHHITDQHGGSEKAFWERVGIRAPDLCADLRDAFLNTRSGFDVLNQHAARAISTRHSTDRRSA